MAGLSMFVEGRLKDQAWAPEVHISWKPNPGCTIVQADKTSRLTDSIAISKTKPVTETNKAIYSSGADIITKRYCEATELELVSKIRDDQELSRQLVYSNNELLHDQKASISNQGKKVDELHSSITRGTPRNPSLQEAIAGLHTEITATRAEVQQLNGRMAKMEKQLANATGNSRGWFW